MGYLQRTHQSESGFIQALMRDAERLCLSRGTTLDKGQLVVEVDNNFSRGIPSYIVKTMTGKEEQFEIDERWLYAAYKEVGHVKSSS